MGQQGIKSSGGNLFDTEEYSSGPYTSILVDTTEYEQVPIEAIRMNTKLGKGAFGTVYTGVYMGNVMALIWELDEDNISGSFFKEVALLQKSEHPKIVQNLGICLYNDRSYLVTEQMDHNLHDMLHLQNVKLTLERKVKLLLDIAFALEHLHVNNILHRDLKPSNVMLDEKNENAKVGGFGLTKNSEYNSEQADVFNFALIMWELFFEKRPYTLSGTITDEEVESAISRKQIPYTPMNRTKYNEQEKMFMDIMQSCFVLDCIPNIRAIIKDLEKIKFV